MALIVYLDFNCPFSALASHRIDLLAGAVDVDVRPVEHDPDIPLDGRAMVGDDRAKLEEETETVRGLVTPDDGDFTLTIPEALPNSSTMCAAYASQPTADLRRRLFDIVWRGAEAGAAAAEVTPDGSADQQRWQHEWEAFGDKKIVPMLVLDDGTVSRGLGALTRLSNWRQ